MAFGGRELKVYLTSDTSKFQKGLKSSGSALSNWAKVGVAAVGALATKFAVDAVNAAAEFEQSLGAIDQVIGGSGAAKIKDWADTTAQAMGLSGQAALDAASSFAISGKSLGLSSDDLADRSIRLTQTAADLAAAFGGTVVDATSKLTAAFRGEFDPIESLGITMNAAAVKAEALALGLSNVDSQASKTKAIESLIAKQIDLLGVAGQNAREADTLQGMQQRLNASWEDAQRIVGEGMVKALSSASGGAETFAESLRTVAENTSDVVYGLGLAVDKLGDFVGASNDSAGGAGNLYAKLYDATKQLNPFTSGLDGLITVLGDSGRAQDEFNDTIQEGVNRMNGYVSSILALRDAANAANDALVPGGSAEYADATAATYNSGYVIQRNQADYLAARNDAMEKARKKAEKRAAKKAARAAQRRAEANARAAAQGVKTRNPA